MKSVLIKESTGKDNIEENEEIEGKTGLKRNGYST